MNKQSNRMEVLGTVNTLDLENLVSLYSSSFSQSYVEGFIQLVKLSFSVNKKELEVQPQKKKTKMVSLNVGKPSINNGFEKLKNPILREKLKKCSTVRFNPKSHIRLKDLGFKSIYELDKKSKKFWREYFKTNKVFLDSKVDSSKLSQRILFNISIVEILKFEKNGSEKSEPTNQ